MSTRWEPAFVAISALIGEPEENPLGGEGRDIAEPGAKSGSREARAIAIARAVSDVAFALDALRLG